MKRTGLVRDALAVLFLAITIAVVAGIIGGISDRRRGR